MSTKEINDWKLIINLLKHQLAIARQIKNVIKQEIKLLHRALALLQQQEGSSEEIKEIQIKINSFRENKKRLKHQLEAMDRRIKKEAEEKLGADFFPF